MTITITFEFEPIIEYNNKQLDNFTFKHLEAIKNSIKYNGRTNSQSAFISDLLGIIELTKINLSAISKTKLSMVLTVNTGIQCKLTIENAEEIIWTIFPIAYNNDDIFLFSVDGFFISRHYKMTLKNMPENITIN